MSAISITMTEREATIVYRALAFASADREDAPRSFGLNWTDDEYDRIEGKLYDAGIRANP